MLKNYLVTSIRFLVKNRLYTLISTLGLAVSISCAIVVYLYIKNELTFDEFHRDIDRLYVLGEGSKEASELEAAYYQTVYPSLPAMLQEFPEIETGTRYFDWDGHILISGEKKFLHQIHHVDSTFLETLSFPLIAGDPKTALAKRGNIVLAEDIALKLFDTRDVIGKTVSLENGKQHIVSGVLGKIPGNSSIQPQVLISLLDKESEEGFLEMGNWYNTIAQVVIKLKPGADPGLLRAKMPAFVERHYDPVAKHRLLKIYPLADLRQSQVDNQTYIYGLASIGIFILLIAVINFMNLSIAGSLKRVRETGMRKVMGSTKQAVAFQFFLESFLLTTSACLISFGLLQLCLPALNEKLGMTLSLSTSHLTEIALLSLILSVIIGLIAGGYPAFHLLSFSTVKAVKGIIPNYQRRVTLRNSLVVVQFIVAITLIIGVIVTSRQIRFMKTSDLKFNRENVVAVNMQSGFENEKEARGQLRSIINKIKERADVTSVSISQTVPGKYSGNYNLFLQEGTDQGVSLRKAYVDDSYLDTYSIRLLEGRHFSPGRADSSNAVMLNMAAVKALGWDSAIGKTLKENGGDQIYTVVGVFDDFHYQTLERSVEPLIHFYFDKIDYANFLNIRLSPGRATDVIAFLQSQWATLDAWLGLDYFFVDEEFDAQYASIERTLVLITLFTCIAIVICCAGIFALSAIAAQQRTKEIGIRKVLGASIPNVVGLLSKDFILLVIIAEVLAIPLAWYGMSQWLKEFAYKSAMEWWIFAIAGSLAMLIAFLTTSIQSVKAAMNNPVDSLHSD